jgi:hypothetical protein
MLVTDLPSPTNNTSAGSKISQVNDYWSKIEQNINPLHLNFKDKIYLDFAFDSAEQFKDDQKYQDLLKIHRNNKDDLNEAYLQELYDIYNEFSREKSPWIKPLSEYLTMSFTSPSEVENTEKFKKLVKKIKYTIQSNLMITHQSFNTHIPKGQFIKPISVTDLSKYYEQCIYFDGEFSWDRDAIIVPGDMRAFSFQDDDQIKTIYVFARYGSSPRKQIVEAMSHYHALNSFKYPEAINDQIRAQFNNRQDFKKYFAFYYSKALRNYQDIEKLDQRDLDFCRQFIFPRPEKLFLPRKYDALDSQKLEQLIHPGVTKNRHHALNASIMYNLGKTNDAEKYLEKYLNIDPKSISLGRHLAFIRLLKGEKREGLFLLSKYLYRQQKDFNLVTYQVRSLLESNVSSSIK